MIGSLYNGIAGITNYSSSLNVGAGNIANASTIGYKSDVITFQDMMYQGGDYGKGVSTQTVEKSFSQGDIQSTNVDYDFAIEGKGFFVLKDTATNDLFYTRAGNFTQSTAGILENKDGLAIQGLQASTLSTSSNNGDTQFSDYYTDFITSTIVSTPTDIISVNTKTTDYKSSATQIGTSGQNLKDISSVVSDIELLKKNYTDKLDLYSANSSALSVSSTNQKTELEYTNYENRLDNSNSSISLQIGNEVVTQNFDTDALTTMNKFTDKISTISGLSASFDSTSKKLTIDTLTPGKNINISLPIGEVTSAVVTETRAVEGSGLAMVESARDALQLALQNANAGFLDIKTTVQAPSQEALVLSDIDLKLDRLGLSDNNDVSFEVVDDGIILLTQSTNSFVVGRLSTAYFPDPTELNLEGNNLYTQTEKSGVAKNADLQNTIVSKNLEISNVSISEGLQQLIIAQRAFEANAKSITTSDEFLKTAIQLKNS